MNSTLHKTTLAMLSVALLGSAANAAAPVKDATALSLTGTKAMPDKAAIEAALAADGLPTDVEGAVQRAKGQRTSGDLAGAAKTLSQVVLVAPDDARVLGEYGKTLVAEGRSNDALAFLERAIELSAADWSLYSAQGVAYDQKGDFRAAQASYGKALALKPGEPTVLSNNALSHVQAGDLDQAEILLNQAAQNGGDYPRIASNLALVQSLKTTQAAKPPVPKATMAAQAPVPPPAAPVAPVMPKPANVAPPAPVVASPIERAPLPAPANPTIVPAPQQAASARAADALKVDPTVHMQAVPKDDKAGPAPKKAVATLPKPAKDSGLLRASLSDADATKQADAGK